MQLEHLLVGDNFRPDVGFVRRRDMRRSFGLVRFSPRPQFFETIRKFSWTGSFTYIEDGAGRLETRELDVQFGIELENSDLFTVGVSNTYEFLPAEFPIASAVTLPGGAYEFTAGRLGYNFGFQRDLSGEVLIEFKAPSVFLDTD